MTKNALSKALKSLTLKCIKCVKKITPSISFPKKYNGISHVSVCRSNIRTESPFPKQQNETVTLTLRSHFLSQCKPLGAITSIILFATLYHLSTGEAVSLLVSIDFAQLRKFSLLFKLFFFYCSPHSKPFKIKVFRLLSARKFI